MGEGLDGGGKGEMKERERRELRRWVCPTSEVRISGYKEVRYQH